jgi:hypothetical protein
MHFLGLAMILVTNSLRDAQARLTLELMLTAQIERRREQTTELKRWALRVLDPIRLYRECRTDLCSTLPGLVVNVQISVADCGI